MRIRWRLSPARPIRIAPRPGGVALSGVVRTASTVDAAIQSTTGHELTRRLQKDQRVATRRSAIAQCFERLSWLNWELRRELFADEAKNGSVVSGRRQQEDHAGGVGIALLQKDATGDSLEITDVGFGVDPYGPSRPIDTGIPCPPVDRASDRQLHDRDLDAPTKPRPEACSQTLEKSKLRCVAYLWAGGIGASRQIHPKDREELRGPDDREVRRLPPADARDLPAAHPQDAAQFGEARPALDPRNLGLTTELPNQRTAAFGASAEGALTCRHARMLALRAYLPVRRVV